MKTREEVLASIKQWPVNIDDVNAPDGWSWSYKGDVSLLICNAHPDQIITRTEWSNYVWKGADPATAKQPDPKGKGDPILGMVLADLTNRALEGNKKYGEPLKAHNGRDALWDAYQEALDLAMYLRQAIEEQRK